MFVFLQSAHWVGTVLLNTVELIERPSKKDGFCFKLVDIKDIAFHMDKLNVLYKISLCSADFTVLCNYRTGR